MTIKQQGGIFGRNPSFNDTEANDLIVNDTLGVGSGTPATNAKAHISRASSGASVLSGTTLALESTGDVILDMLSPADGRALIVFGNASSSQRGDLLYDHNADTLRVRVGNTTQATFNTSGLAFPSGKGIDFSATSDGSGTTTSELFDDYEEGTWTPVFADAASGGNTSASVFSGDYTKVGNLVFVNCSLVDIDTTGLTSGNDLYIQGLPFTPKSGTLFAGSVFGRVTISGKWCTAAISTSAAIRLEDNPGTTANPSRVPVSGIVDDGGDLRISITYIEA